jgi:hypothetical protein
MGQTYTRQSAFSDGDTITASLFNNEFDQLVNAFNNSTGHTHDGTSGEGGPITVVGPNQDVSVGSTAVLPANNNTVNLGSATFQFKDGYFDGVVTLDGLVIGTSTSVTSVDTDLSSVSASDDTLASAKAIKTYVDAQLTAQDLDFQADTGGALSIDLDSETLIIAGTANEIETAGSGNTVTIGLPNNVTIGNNLTVTNNLITNNDVQFTGTAGNIIFDKSADTLGLQDNVILAFGDDDDFKIYHNGTNTVMVDANATSTIVVANDLGVSVTNAAGTTSSATFAPSGAATLYHNGSSKLATKSDGIDVTGEVQSDSLDVDGNADISGNLVVGGNTTLGDAGTDSVTVNAVVASDLIPYADGTYDLGSASLEWQDLYIDGTAHVDAINYDGTLITATAAELNILDGVTATATEINLLDGVTATTGEINRLDITTVGALEANKVLTADASGNINFSSANMTNVDIDSGTIDGVTISTSNITVPATKTLDVSAGTLTLADDQISGDKVEGGTIAATTITALTTGSISSTGNVGVGGDLTVTGDLTVNGTTTTLNTTTLDVEDINITIANGAADAAAANGAGITIDGADATITYNSTSDAMEFNKDISVDTINELTAANGVVIDGVTLKDGGAAFTSAIDVTGTVTADGLTVDTNTLYVDATNNRVGIGTSSPSYSLDIVKSGFGFKFNGSSSDNFTQQLFETDTGNYEKFVIAYGASHSTNPHQIALKANNASGSIGFYTNAIERMHIDASGNVGIATDDPNAALTVAGSGVMSRFRTGSDNDGRIEFAYNTTDIGYINMASASKFDIFARSGVDLTLGAGGSEAMRIDSDGNVGIGTDDPSWKFTIDNGEDNSIIQFIKGAGNSYIGLGVDGDDAILTAGTSSASEARNLVFRTANSSGVESERMRIDSSGRVGIGTSSPASKLDVAGTATVDDLVVATNSSGTPTLTLQRSSLGIDSATDFRLKNSSGDFVLTSHASTVNSGAETDRLKVSYIGDVSFYDDTGADAEFRWDASNAFLGLGTTSPSTNLHVYSATRNNVALFESGDADVVVYLRDSNTTNISSVGIGATTDDLTLRAGNEERMRIKSNGYVGIGTSNPSRLLNVLDTGFGLQVHPEPDANYSAIRFTTDDTDNDKYMIAYGVDSTSTPHQLALKANNASGSIGFFTNTTEKVHIDADGNVGIGTNDPATELHILKTTQVPTVRIETTHPSGIPLLELKGAGGASQLKYVDETGVTQSRIDLRDGGEVRFNDVSSGSTVERMRIHSNGRVGIGTSSPVELTHIVMNTANSAYIDAVGSSNVDSGLKVENVDTAVGSYCATHYRAGNADVKVGCISQGSNDGDFFVTVDGSTTHGVYRAMTYDATGDVLNLSGDLTFLGTNGGAGVEAKIYIPNTGSGDKIKIVNPANSSVICTFDENLNVTIGGALSKASGSFKIDHPLKPETHQLVHSFVEAPQADNLYRGKVELVNGTATVNIDTVAGMTEGTFAALNREVQCFTTNESGWTAIKGSVNGNILTIEAQDNTCTDTISWMVIGERQDQHMYDTDWTDENGKVIVEPEKVEEAEGA